MKNPMIIFGLAAGAAIAQTPSTQTKEVQKQIHVITAQTGAVSVSSSGTAADTMVFVANEFNLGGKAVLQAPYSAEAVTESVQTLADGNRIVNKNTALVYRDGEGRTRREQSLQVMGPFSSAQTAKKSIIINDPSAKVTYILDPETKTARKIGLRTAAVAGMGGNSVSNFVFERRMKGPDGKESVDRKTGDEAKTAMEALHKSGKLQHTEGSMHEGAPFAIAGGGGMANAVASARLIHGASQNAKIDQLGKRVIEGVECTGVKTTETIAAGTMGNERAIEIVSETWSSADLQTAVQTRRSDPRMGDTTYKLQNVRRGEPGRNLFEVPADYKIVDANSGNMMFFNHKIEAERSAKETTI